MKENQKSDAFVGEFQPGLAKVVDVSSSGTPHIGIDLTIFHGAALYSV